jgi:hypothetical protein
MRAIFLTSLPLALFACTDSARSDADEYARRFSIQSLGQSNGPEVRIWAEDTGYGGVSGYVVRPGEISSYRGGFNDDGAFVVGEHRTVRNEAASHELLELIPELSRIRQGVCPGELHESAVTIEGVNGNSRFIRSVHNYSECEGWNLHILDRAFEIAGRATHATNPD